MIFLHFFRVISFKHRIISDVEINFDQDVDSNDHSCSSPIGEQGTHIQEDFHSPIALDANANREDVFSRLFYSHNITEVTLY